MAAVVAVLISQVLEAVLEELVVAEQVDTLHKLEYLVLWVLVLVVEVAVYMLEAVFIQMVEQAEVA